MTARKTARSRSRSKPAADPAAESPATAQAPTPAAPLYSAQVDARWRDLDAFNHVNNATYLTYLEEARLQWLGQIKGSWFSEHAMPVLAASEINYRQPISWPARLQVQLAAVRVGGSSLTLAHRIADAQDPAHLYADGQVVIVWVDPAKGTPVELPAAIRAAAG